MSTNSKGIYYSTSADAPITEEARSLALANSVPVGPNYIINGAFDIWQRGAGPWAASGLYTADRWQLNATANAVRSTDTPNSNFLYSLEYSNSGTQSWCSVRQLIESINSKHLVGKKVTVSFWMKRISASGSTMVLEMGYASSPDNFSTITGLPTITSSVTPSSSWQYVSVTTDVLPAGVANGLYLGFTLSNATNAQMNLRITGVQLEEGSVATPFRRNAPSIQAELLACQRYYQLGAAGAAGRWNSGTSGEVAFKFIGTMRTAPSIAHLANYTAFRVGITPVTITNTTFNGVTAQGCCLMLTTTNVAAGDHAIISGTSVDSVAFSAEL